MTIRGARQDESRRALRRWIAVSALAHALGLALAAWMPLPASRADLPPVVQVDLMARAPSPGPPDAPAPAPAPEAEAEPEPAPAPAPEPEPEPPEPAETVLPETPQQPPEPEEPEAEPEPEPPAEAEVPEPETTPTQEAPAEPSPKQEEEDYEDLLARLRSEEGEAEPGGEGAEESAPDAREGPAGGAGIPVSAAERAWMRRAKVHVKRVWVLPAGYRNEPLETQVQVRLGPTGEVRSVEVAKSSGNPFYDDFVERAVLKASPFPEPPEAAEWQFVFRPEEPRR